MKLNRYKNPPRIKPNRIKPGSPTIPLDLTPREIKRYKRLAIASKMSFNDLLVFAMKVGLRDGLALSELDEMQQCLRFTTREERAWRRRVRQ